MTSWRQVRSCITSRHLLRHYAKSWWCHQLLWRQLLWRQLLWRQLLWRHHVTSRVMTSHVTSSVTMATHHHRRTMGPLGAPYILLTSRRHAMTSHDAMVSHHRPGNCRVTQIRISEYNHISQSGGLELWPMTLTYTLIQDIVKEHAHTKFQAHISIRSAVRVVTNTQTHWQDRFYYLDRWLLIQAKPMRASPCKPVLNKPGTYSSNREASSNARYCAQNTSC